MSDDEFREAYDKYGETALTYNDQTSTLYSSYGRIENGEVVIYGVKIPTKVYRRDYQLEGINTDGNLITGEPPLLPGFSAFKWASLWKSVKGIFRSHKIIKEAAKESVIGEKVTSFTRHATQQAITRGFKPSDILKIVREGKPVEAVGRYGTQIRYVLNGNVVVVNDKGKIVSVFSNFPGTRNKSGAEFLNIFE